MGTAQELRTARARIADPKHWTTKSCARDAAGNECNPTSGRATCFCALGALAVETGSFRGTAHEALKKARIRLFPEAGSVPGVNDKLGHAAVLALYDAAIADVEAC